MCITLALRANKYGKKTSTELFPCLTKRQNYRAGTGRRFSMSHSIHTPYQVTRAKALSVSRCRLLLINAAPPAPERCEQLRTARPDPPLQRSRRRARSRHAWRRPCLPSAHSFRPGGSQISYGTPISHGNLLPSTQGVTRGQTRPDRGKPGPGRGAEPGAGPAGVRACGQGHLARPGAAGSARRRGQR